MSTAETPPAAAFGWLGATLLNPPLVLTGAVHLMGCEP